MSVSSLIVGIYVKHKVINNEAHLNRWILSVLSFTLWLYQGQNIMRIEEVLVNDKLKT